MVLSTAVFVNEQFFERGKISHMKNFFKKLFGEKYPGRAEKNNRMKCVYAGPEQMARRFGRMEKVYAGPPIWERDDDNAMEDVYAGPEQMEPDPETMMAVYAGPEQMGSDPRTMMMVYAGPAQMGPDPLRMMMVYAGPGQFPQTDPSTDKPEEQTAREVTCRVCGGAVLEKQKYCPNCGVLLQDDTTPGTERT